MIQAGDLVKSKTSGRIGIVTGQVSGFWGLRYVLFHDNTYTIHKNNLEPLETK